jgi:phosphatidylglycerol:prolipoprotein diacylglycerol transferase
VYYGGFVAAAVTAVVYMRRHGLPVGKVVDVMSPALALGQSVGRVGCLAAGCCYGAPASVPWAITFTSTRAHEITRVPLQQPLHPSQVYLSLNALLLCGMLLLVLKVKRAKGWPDGLVFWSYVVLYGVTRFALEYFRADDRGRLGAFSTSQVLGIAGAMVGLVALALMARRRWRHA